MSARFNLRNVARKIPNTPTYILVLVKLSQVKLSPTEYRKNIGILTAFQPALLNCIVQSSNVPFALAFKPTNWLSDREKRGPSLS